MADEVANLILEYMRHMRADMARMSDRLDTMSAELLIIRQHTAAMIGTQALHETKFAGIEVRLNRIERRLDLVD
jgi:hypothetical protein